jgi:hypothetical protein
LHCERMAPHPLDISRILHSKGVEPQPSSHKTDQESPKPRYERQEKPAPRKTEPLFPRQDSPRRDKVMPQTPISNGPALQDDVGIKINSEYWSLLNEESRRMLTSRIWRHVDFNPMLAELDDISKLTEKWLKWAVPTYVNGLPSGPIRDWLDGKREARDFHYVLVGEHLKHLKEMRQKRKEEDESPEALSKDAPEPALAEQPVLEVSPPVQADTSPLSTVDELEAKPTELLGQDNSQDSAKKTTVLAKEAAIRELDEHIAWFQAYVESKKKSSTGPQ